MLGRDSEDEDVSIVQSNGFSYKYRIFKTKVLANSH